ncbi:DUF2185 domain-containing protein [Anaeromyxobacter diazotrophicus]|uniref:Immunity protein Imm33 domain-containing protein n=1 Tax=Anaeromyxobacter diazotrophicus TaxID=2590199 RepID=A0A7I9VMA8_9BACT|nr:DUF2185 domain-containing protein [Anaeromyxobacter diazotrophicus]GEJ57531.1 hypothetical protein AMYX_22720 [Anaeromyxobacter diazotrophicus]
MEKKFKLNPEELRPVAVGFGACLASDRITVEGSPVGFMYREEPDNEADSGWRFLSGDETDAYLNDAANFEIYDVNTIANYDPSITPQLEAPPGSEFEKPPGSERFVPVRD